MPTFSINNKHIEISDQLDIYNTHRKKYQNEATNYLTKFAEIYDSASTYRKMVDSVYEFGLKLHNQKIQECLDHLVSKGCISYNLITLGDKYFDESRTFFIEAMEEYIDDHELLEEKTKATDKHRTNRRYNRGRVVGGGFGLGGFIQGALTAAALNTITNVAHGTFNTVAKAGSMIGDAVQKGGLIGEHRNRILNAFYNSIFLIHIEAIHCFNAEIKANMRIFNHDEDKFDAIIENIQKYNLDGDTALPHFQDIITVYPYKEELYALMNKMYGNNSNQIGKLANYFGMEFADLVNNQFYNDTVIQLKACKSEQAALDLQNTVINTATSQDLLDFYYTRLETKFNETINKLAYKERGYDGIICDSLADREQLKHISSLAKLSKEATIIMIRQNLSNITEIEANLTCSYIEYMA